jgi:chromosomal replication initiation ATPase DnaA
MGAQEIFAFHKSDSLDWGDFIESHENRDAVACLAKWNTWNGNGIVIYGESGVGKTHLASLWAQSSNAVYVLKSSIDNDPRLLFESECNFIIDNFDDFLAINNSWMFHFLNISKETNRFFLLISRTNPALWKIELNDLRSRILALSIINMKNPECELLLKITKKISKDIGVIISDDAIKYMMNFVNRDVISVATALKTFDKLALQKQKPITIPFIKNYLGNSVSITKPQESPAMH